MNAVIQAVGQLIASALVVATLGIAVFAASPSEATMASSNSTNLGQAGFALDPQIAVPESFPADFPVYPGARPTEQVVLPAKSITSWVITWETVDDFFFARAFYSDSLKSGDWTIKRESTTGGIYSAVFTRRSHPRFGGMISIEAASKPGVVTISVALTNWTS